MSAKRKTPARRAIVAGKPNEPSAQTYALVPIAKLHEHPDNPNQGQLAIIEQSLAENGFYGAVTAQRSTGFILSGNHRFRAYVSSGAQHVPTIYVDVDDVRARKIMLVDNASRDAAEYDLPKLAALLQEFVATAVDAEHISAALSGTGFDAARFDEILRDVAAARDDDDSDDDDSESAQEQAARAAQAFALYSRKVVTDNAMQFFRALGHFPYPSLALHEQQQQLNMLHELPDARAWTTPLGHRIADTYHRQRFACSAVGKRSPERCFRNDACLRHALSWALDNGTRISQTLPSGLAITLGTQACANFRPGVAMALIRRFTPKGGRVLDPCHGFGGRLVGWIAAGLGGHYVGVDPSPSAHDGNVRLARALGVSSRVTLLKRPFEDVTLAQLGGARSCAFALTSPPYFTKEVYGSEATQSRVRYPTPDAWRSQFLQPLLALVQRALKPRAIFALNIADVEIAPRKRVPLEAWSVDDAKAVGFTFVERLELSLHRRVGTGHDDGGEAAIEPVFILRNGK